ncbi:MAG: hypothetical protein K6F05_04415 [Succinivibrio sp.]|nr:hypothetical protein [Succinivibrio sp.]
MKLNNHRPSGFKGSLTGLLLVSGFVIAPDPVCSVAHAALVPGFAEQIEKSAPPNTVKGVLKTAREGDYCLLRGVFLNKISDFTFAFQDDEGTSVEVRFKPEAGLATLFLEREYFLWATVEKEHRKTFLKAQIFAPAL